MIVSSILVEKLVATAIELCEDTVLTESYQIRMSQNGGLQILMLFGHLLAFSSDMPSGALIGG